jgi:spore germination cell wall hydrolase CwlJ-like protein
MAMPQLLTRRIGSVLALLLGSGALLLLTFAGDHPRTPGAPIRSGAMTRLIIPPLPEPEAFELQPLRADDALAANQAIPFSKNRIQIAPPFQAGASGQSVVHRKPALDCLTSAVYYEAASESEAGQRAVAQVVLNRVRHPAFPASVCGVVYQGSERHSGCQFSFTCDGSLNRKPETSGWARAKRVASLALAGRVEPTVGMATHYHANYVLPYWAPKLAKIVVVGNHIFYRWRGYWGTRAAFTQNYAGDAASAYIEAADLFETSEGDFQLEPSEPLADALDPSARLRAGGVALPGIEPPRADENKARLKADDVVPVLIIDEPANE